VEHNRIYDVARQMLCATNCTNLVYTINGICHLACVPIIGRPCTLNFRPCFPSPIIIPSTSLSTTHLSTEHTKCQTKPRPPQLFHPQPLTPSNSAAQAKESTLQFLPLHPTQPLGITLQIFTSPLRRSSSLKLSILTFLLSLPCSQARTFFFVPSHSATIPT